MTQASASRCRLAIDDGSPIRTAALPPWPVFDNDQIEAAAGVLRSGKVNYWTGPHGRLFEEEFARSVDCRHAVAVASGTAALELALCALGIGIGDEVVVTSRSFIASASCCGMRGAVPVFADVDPASQNMTPQTIRPVLTPRTRAIIAVHLAGWPCEMDPIMELAKEHNLAVIEDCAQAQGAAYGGRPVGSIGHAAAFSFCQDRIMTTGGEGGMLTTNDPAVWQRAWSFKDHGKSRQAVESPNPPGVFQWLHESRGTNWRMTEMQAAIGRTTLGRVPSWVERRRKNASILHALIARLPLRLPEPPDHIAHAYHEFYAFVRPRWLRSDWSRDRIAAAIRAEGIPCGSGSCPEIYREKAFDGWKWRKRFPVAKGLGETSLMFQVHPALAERDVIDTGRAVEKVMRAACLRISVPRLKAA